MDIVKLRADIEQELHDLCQPLTAASCHLELAQMMGDDESMRTAVDGALTECRRTFAHVEQMRRRIAELLNAQVSV